jgi:hypothetical protein
VQRLCVDGVDVIGDDGIDSSISERVPARSFTDARPCTCMVTSTLRRSSPAPAGFEDVVEAVLADQHEHCGAYADQGVGP